MTTSVLEIGIALYLCIGVIMGCATISPKFFAEQNIVTLLAVFAATATYWPIYLVGSAIDRMRGEP